MLAIHTKNGLSPVHSEGNSIKTLEEKINSINSSIDLIKETDAGIDQRGLVEIIPTNVTTITDDTKFVLGAKEKTQILIILLQIKFYKILMKFINFLKHLFQKDQYSTEMI